MAWKGQFISSSLEVGRIITDWNGDSHKLSLLKGWPRIFHKVPQ